MTTVVIGAAASAHSHWFSFSLFGKESGQQTKPHFAVVVICRSFVL